MLVIDSSFLIAYHNTRDVHHGAAASAMDELVVGTWGRALLLEYVFLEVVTVLRARLGVAAAGAVGATLLGAREVDFLPCSEIFLDTFESFRTQGAAGLSFTDAAIVTAAREHQARYVATFDRDFIGIEGIDVIPGE